LGHKEIKVDQLDFKAKQEHKGLKAIKAIKVIKVSRVL
jgi:hypothetical protein